MGSHFRDRGKLILSPGRIYRLAERVAERTARAAVCLLTGVVAVIAWHSIDSALQDGRIQRFRHIRKRHTHPLQFWAVLAGWVALAGLLLLTLIATFEYILIEMKVFNAR